MASHQPIPSQKRRNRPRWRGIVCAALFGAALAALLLAPVSTPAESFIDKLFGMSREDEVKLGREVAKQVERKMRVLYVPEVVDYINELGQRLVRHSLRSNLPHTFKVVKKRSINAFALPGGFVYVHTGLIAAADTEMELAGVLGHEIGHVSGRHHSEQLAKMQAVGIGSTILGGILVGVTGRTDVAAAATQLASAGAYMKFSRDAEREADRLGAQMLYRSGINPRGMVTFFEKLEKQRNERGQGTSDIEVFFSTHPTPMERRANVSALISSFPPEAGLVSDTQRFQGVRAIVRRMLDPSDKPPAGRLPPFLRTKRR